MKGLDMKTLHDGPQLKSEEKHRGSCAWVPEILCTLGPASLDRRTIQRLEQSGATLFRINLSHTKVEDLARIIRTIREATQVPICLDSEGAQIRTGEFVDGSINLRDNSVVRVHFRRVPGDDKNFNFYPLDIARRMQVGDFVSIDFNSALVQVIAKKNDCILMRVMQGGPVGQNKAVTVERDIPMPPLTDKDVAAFSLGRRMGLSHYALSFAGSGEDVRAVRSLLGENAFIISKIESRSGLMNLEQITAESDALLIDRGDLSRQVALEMLPQVQKDIIMKANKVGRRVYVATNLLESMVSMPTPTRAEVNDIYNTLADGAGGLVLAAETAIGKYPIQCASMINKIIRVSCRNGSDGGRFYPLDAVSLLVEPHGGRLVHREAKPDDLADIERLPRLAVSESALVDCEQFAYGTYSPLAGFMSRETLQAVLDSYRLPNGVIWPLPILLQVDSQDLEKFAVGDRVALSDDQDGIHAFLDVSDVYRYDLESLAARVYGTTSRRHPGVARLFERDNCFVGGDVTLVRPLESPLRHYLLTPTQSRFVFTRLGWSQVVGFHCQIPAHRGHEFIQMQALERSGADGIYINPVTGPKMKGDFLAEPIILSYQTLLEFGCYPKGKVVLGGFFTYARHAGPRETVFSALCRKNMGCSHFIVGNDSTGLVEPAAYKENRQLFDSLGDIGITPVYFESVGFNNATGTYEAYRGQPLTILSETMVRDTLRADKHLPGWFMRDLVQDVLLDKTRPGGRIFQE
jgi:ATP sulfurylase